MIKLRGPKMILRVTELDISWTEEHTEKEPPIALLKGREAVGMLFGDYDKIRLSYLDEN